MADYGRNLYNVPFYPFLKALKLSSYIITTLFYFSISNKTIQQIFYKKGIYNEKEIISNSLNVNSVRYDADCCSICEGC